MDNYKKKLHFHLQRICIPKKNSIYYNSWLHIFIFLNSFTGYVYAGFQISKHGKYALKICISKKLLYYLIKRTYNSNLAF
jgi:hypothetical protein